MVVVVDYKAGNIGSIQNMLNKIGIQAKISDEADDILKAERIILPGVGAFDYGMAKLEEAGLIQVLNQRVIQEGTPVLGICLGAQLMCQSSEEGSLAGLGWIDAKVKKFPTNHQGNKVAVPHMGWDIVSHAKPSRLSAGWMEKPRFYFVHSYYIECRDRADALFVNTYAIPFDSAFERGNIVGVQFHPEKSHKFGKQLLKNFIDLY